MDLKEGARERLQSSRSELLDLSHRIHANPELGYEEVQASGWLEDLLDGAGFRVKKGICDLPTAFEATFGSGPLKVGICAEYDALPGVGHACGHNVIAAMAAGAALSVSKVADEAGLTVTVLGTPAEEVGIRGGKVLMLERGAFQGLHAAMMVHPAPFDVVTPRIIAAAVFDVHYYGKEAHASAFPELGINAADAITVAQTAIGLLRQHIRPTDRIHGIVTKGGEAPNIVPAHTISKFIVRSQSLDELEELRARVEKCFEAGALATGSRLEYEGGDRPYAHMLHDAPMGGPVPAQLRGPGQDLPGPGGGGGAGCGLHGHGQRVPGPSIHTPHDRHRLPARREPSARVCRPLRHRGGGQGDHGRRPGHGMDGH